MGDRAGGGDGRAQPVDDRPAAPRIRPTGAGLPAPAVNACLGSRELEEVCRLDGAGEDLLRRAVERWGLSARGYHRVLRLARTVADLAGSDSVRAAHVAEAVSYRVLDREEG